MVAITTLMNERAGLGASAALGLSNSLDELIELAKEQGKAEDPIVRDKIARLKIGIEGLRLGAMRALTATMKVGIPGPEGSIAKLQWSSTHQAMTELALEVGGLEALESDNPGPTASCARGRTRSRAGPPTCSRTSSPSVFSAFPS